MNTLLPGGRRTPVARLPPDVRAAILRDAATRPDEERCGILVGTLQPDAFLVRRYVPVANASARRADRFRIPARAVHAAQRQAQAGGLDVIGFAHSHPQGPSQPSRADLRDTLPGYLHIIVDATSNALEGWRLRAEDSGFEDVMLIEEAG